MGELRKRFSHAPDDITNRTLDDTTQCHLDVKEENQSNPQKHFRKRFKAIPDRRQNEEVATDFVYFSTKSCQGHKGAQFFSAVSSEHWAFCPLQRESQNVKALQDHFREHGPPITLVSDNAKSETGKVWNITSKKWKIPRFRVSRWF